MNEETNPADLAQRVAELEQERDAAQQARREVAEQIRAITAERDELRAKYDELLVALHGIGRALGLAEGARSPYSITCGVLDRVNRLADLGRQEPTCWAVIDPTGGGSVEYTAAWREACHEHIGDLVAEYDRPDAANLIVRPLYARPVHAIPEGWKLVKVKAAEFDSLMYWLDRCESKGRMERCSDLIEPWFAFEYADVAAPEHKA